MSSDKPFLLTVLIVEDEARARRALTRQLLDYCEGVSVLAAVGTVEEAMAQLERSRPQVVFLDVQLPGASGFSLAERPELCDLPIVFVTAHADYALRAFRVNAIDYLLKPVALSNLRESLARVRQRLALAENRDGGNLIVYAAGEEHCIALRQVLYLQADGSYTYVVTTDARLLVSRTLARVGNSLPAAGFVRVHRSYLVNLAHLVGIGPANQPSCRLSNGVTLPMSRYRRSEVLEQLRNRAQG